MHQIYYLNDQGQSVGPYDTGTLQGLLAAGIVGRHTMSCHPGDTRWTPLPELHPELFLPADAPGLPPPPSGDNGTPVRSSAPATDPEIEQRKQILLKRITFYAILSAVIIRKIWQGL